MDALTPSLTNQKELLEVSGQFLMNTYARHPVALVKGRGLKVWDMEGTEYLDFMSGIAVNALGHCHPKVVVAIQKQAQRLLHVSNLFHISPQTELGALLVKRSFADKAFFCNSGTEAIEAAIKLARKYSKETHGPDRYEIVAAHGSFHGRTMAALSATGQEKHRKGFGPMLQGFRFVPYNDAEAIHEAVGPHTCAVLLEPVQGEGGVHVPDAAYLQRVRELCSKKDILLIFDEIQTGIGRTGHLFAYEAFNVVPDVMALAKGLGGGMAIGCLLSTAKVASAFSPGTHGTTFGGNPLACAAALATLRHILEDDILLANVRRMSDYLLSGLRNTAARFSQVVAAEPRGLGLLLGLPLAIDCSRVVRAALQARLLLTCAGDNVLRFTPPLVVEEADIDDMLDRLATALSRGAVE